VIDVLTIITKNRGKITTKHSSGDLSWFDAKQFTIKLKNVDLFCFSVFWKTIRTFSKMNINEFKDKTTWIYSQILAFIIFFQKNTVIFKPVIIPELANLM
jgi:hypothetical protein